MSIRFKDFLYFFINNIISSLKSPNAHKLKPEALIYNRAQAMLIYSKIKYFNIFS